MMKKKNIISIFGPLILLILLLRPPLIFCSEHDAETVLIFSEEDAEEVLKELRNEEGEVGVHVVSWRWDEVGVYITITLFVVLSGLAKVGE